MLNNLSNRSPYYAAQDFFKVSITLKYRVYLRLYLIKITNVLAKFGLEKQFKVKKAYFMTTKINIIGEK